MPPSHGITEVRLHDANDPNCGQQLLQQLAGHGEGGRALGMEEFYIEINQNRTGETLTAPNVLT